ncbi:hypothetical protein M885DRAFT_549558 [Pelagophyceae sp. CCMP2097]|nr:hypothetical protein M885DRAFT_549558 [Pelagophyceae sp. CCMP2097]|mmetsp:Transcript_22736/g.76852  ORF Transcript_22736/g.76852 Transcript_22736/m.76852 type:complete len:224 (+) Transcript_22736:50-721(+)
MSSLRRALALFGCAAAAKQASMNCGEATICGVLAISSGLGPGAYHHAAPTIHGLWPEVGSYGTSACVAPAVFTNPTEVHGCYAADGGPDSAIISFETHEWDKHGECAGVHDEADYFAQVCSLAQRPIAAMSTARSGGADLAGMQAAVEATGLEVFSANVYNSELYLSACATPAGVWKLSNVSDFSANCGAASSDTVDFADIVDFGSDVHTVDFGYDISSAGAR